MKYYKPRPGEDIQETCKRLVEIQVESGDEVQAEFNEVILIANKNSTIDGLIDFYHKQTGYDPKKPDPLRNPEEFDRESAKRFHTMEFPKWTRIDEEQYQALLKQSWNSGYSLCAMYVASRWANIMESRMLMGEQLEDIAEATYREADTEGTTGFMYGWIVAHLAYYWIYGESLRQWSNLDVQISNEGEEANRSGGVLNPAVINIGSKK